MALQRNKGVLEGNIFSSGNQTLTIRGVANLTLLSRDAIALEQNMIELADKTRVPGGRNNSGEFTAVAQLALDRDREAFLAWYDMCLDRGRGINPTYKRDGVITYMRHFQGSPGTEFSGAGSQGEPFRLKLIGLWIQKLEFPEFDMAGGDEGDASSKLTGTFCYDDVDPERRRGGGLLGNLLNGG